MEYNNKIQTNTYNIGGGFMVDIAVDSTEQVIKYEAYIYHKDYDVKMFMFGAEAIQQTYSYFCELVDKNKEEYKADYIAGFMDD